MLLLLRLLAGNCTRSHATVATVAVSTSLSVESHSSHDESTRFEPKISADERPQTHALDRAATGMFILKCSLKLMQ